MKKYSFWIIISLLTFLVGFGSVLASIYYIQKEIIEIKPVPLFDNSCVKPKSFPGLSKEISKLKKGKSRYFPKNTWKRFETADASMNDWYSRYLKAMDEKSLLDVSDNNTEIYRFLWLRSFHHPIFVRIERNGKSIQLFSKELDAKGGTDPGNVIRTVSINLDESQWCDFLSLLEQSKYWQMPAEEDNTSGNDGAQWILEGVRENRYHVVDRWSPGDKSGFGEACVYLLKLSGVDTDRLKDELY